MELDQVERSLSDAHVPRLPVVAVDPAKRQTRRRAYFPPVPGTQGLLPLAVPQGRLQLFAADQEGEIHVSCHEYSRKTTRQRNGFGV
jgi:hypothetical protein